MGRLIGDWLSGESLIGDWLIGEWSVGEMSWSVGVIGHSSLVTGELSRGE